jgi:hypothetical protein
MSGYHAVIRALRKRAEMNTLDRLKELHEKATPGPWEATDLGDVRISNGGIHLDTECDKENAQLIAEMRNNISKLLAVVDAARYVAGIIPEYGPDKSDMADLRDALATLES